MKPIKITIQGSFLDCQLYRGRLYLWTFDGKLCVYNWNGLVDSLMADEKDFLAFKYSFKEGSALYTPSLVDFLNDDDVNSLLKKKISSLESYKLMIDESLLKKNLIGEMDTLLGDLPIDTEIYNNYLYFSTERGLFRSTAHKKSGNPVSNRPFKLWDARILSMRANRYPQMAISAGDDGLFEMFTGEKENHTLGLNQIERNIFKVSEKHSTFANYSNLSIYSSSLSGISYLALFKWEKSVESNDYSCRKYSEIFDSFSIFGDNSKSLSWGGDGKFFKITETGFNIVAFDNYGKSDIFTAMREYKESMNKGRVIGGSSAYFGNIVEFEEGLLIVQSDGNSLFIDQPVIRWRIYPRSKNYENQLHVLLDDCMEIYSFNHDYFLSQSDKIIGINYVGER